MVVGSSEEVAAAELAESIAGMVVIVGDEGDVLVVVTLETTVEVGADEDDNEEVDDCVELSVVVGSAPTMLSEVAADDVAAAVGTAELVVEASPTRLSDVAADDEVAAVAAAELILEMSIDVLVTLVLGLDIDVLVVSVDVADIPVSVSRLLVDVTSEVEAELDEADWLRSEVVD